MVKATQLRQQWQSRDFSQLPPITVKNFGNSGIFGAYSSSINKIYISQALIDSGDATTLSAVLLEEIGHFIDAQINSSDTPGDEGQLFSALVRGEVLTKEQIAAIREENDAATITVDGQAISVEMASIPKITIAPGTNPLEGGTVGTFIITLDTAAPTGGLVVNFNTTGSTATLATDYSFTAGTNITAVTANTFTIAAGATTATLNVVAVSDAVSDPNETVKVNLTSGGDYILGANSSASFNPATNFTVGNTPRSVTVGDFNGDGKSDLAVANFGGNNVSVFLNADPTTTATVTTTDVSQPPISLTINDVTITEGNSGTTNAVFTVSLSSAASTVVSVDYATANGTATAGTDYTAIPPTTTLTFNPGETSKTITVAVNGDNQVESNETFFVNLSNLQTNGSNVTLADSQGQGTINNDDSASISISDVTITEGNSGTTNAVFTVTLSNPVDTAITLDYATADGTATTTDNDYTAIAATPLIFNAGETSKTITVAVNGDNQFESNETGSSRLCVIIFAYGIVKCLLDKTFKTILRIFYQYRPRFHTETRRARDFLSQSQ